MKDRCRIRTRAEFSEGQKFRQWWLWFILVGIGLVTLYELYLQLIQGKEFGNEPMPDYMLVIYTLFIFGLLFFFRFIELKTEIDRIGIRINFRPFMKREYRWDEISSARVVNYGFQGGWGIRLGTKYGTLYNISGNKGLAIELKSGKKFCIGTRKEVELGSIVERYHREQHGKGKY